MSIVIRRYGKSDSGQSLTDIAIGDSPNESQLGTTATGSDERSINGGENATWVVKVGG